MNSDLLSVDSWMCLHVTHDMLMCCYLFFWFWHYWLFPTVEDTNSVFFPTENLPTSKPHSTPLLCLQRCVTLLVRSIFSVYTNMVMKIFTAELSSIMISITFPSLYNFLSSLELLVFLCLFNLPCFLLTYHWFIPKIISNYLKFKKNEHRPMGVCVLLYDPMVKIQRIRSDVICNNKKASQCVEDLYI